MNTHSVKLTSAVLMLLPTLLQGTTVQHTIVERSGNPIELEARTGEQSGINYLDLIPKNIGSKEIVAYVLVVKHYDRAARSSTNFFERKKLAIATDTPFSPGKVWGAHRVFISASAVLSEVSADYVVFADGTDWGPDTLERGVGLKARIIEEGQQAGQVR